MKISNQELPLINALIYASYMRSILDSWDYRESTNALNKLKQRVKTFMDMRKRKNPKLYAYSVTVGDIAWKETITKYASERVPIDGAMTVIAIWNSHEEILNKYGNISEAIMESFTLKHYDGALEYINEKNAHDIVKYLVMATNKAHKVNNDM